jgi:L-threonylcarbamoyladenylate synthase
MRVIEENSKAVEFATSTLKKGGLVIFPCETVYGIAVDCLNAKAVKKLNLYKQRPLGKPYAIMCSSQKMAEEYVELNETARNLYKTFLPGPMTIVSKGRHKVAEGIESEIGTLGVRIPDYPFMLKLIAKFGHPIVATSANTSYQKRPYKVSDILDNLSQKQKASIDLIIDAGELPHHEPSTVVDTTLDDPVILRQGDIKLKDKNDVLSRSEENSQNIGKELWQKYEKYLGKRAIVFALEGPMGAGKTIFTKGLAKALGIKKEIVSPTYDLEIEYQSRDRETKLTHIDCWRLEKPEELKGLGFTKKITDKSVIAIEWADRVASEIHKYDDQAVVIWVRIAYGKKENERVISWGVS